MTTHANPGSTAAMWVVSTNTWHITCYSFLVSLLDHTQPSLLDSFGWPVCHMMCFHVGRCHLGVTLILLRSKHNVVDMNNHFSQTCKILKVTYYWNYSVTDKYFVGCSNIHTSMTNPIWHILIFWKINKSTSQQWFNQLWWTWHSDASGPCNSFNCLGHFKNVCDDDDDDWLSSILNIQFWWQLLFWLCQLQ